MRSDADGNKLPYSETCDSAVDTDLIAGIEREILDTSPKVRWDDIAGLKAAKVGERVNDGAKMGREKATHKCARERTCTAYSVTPQ